MGALVGIDPHSTGVESADKAAAEVMKRGKLKPLEDGSLSLTLGRIEKPLLPPAELINRVGGERPNAKTVFSDCDYLIQ